MGLLKHSSRDSPPEPSGRTPEPPPAYSEGAESDVTAGFAKLSLKETGEVPSIDECIAHLKLLEAINQLREDVATQDGLYGIKDSFVPENVSEQTRSQTLAKIREKRWAVYVTIAVKRFETYFQTIQPNSRMMDIKTMKSPEYGLITDTGGVPGPNGKFEWVVDNLPPLGWYFNASRI